MAGVGGLTTWSEPALVRKQCLCTMNGFVALPCRVVPYAGRPACQVKGSASERLSQMKCVKYTKAERSHMDHCKHRTHTFRVRR